MQLPEITLNYCAVCGSKHPVISECPKYGINVCYAHCEMCEYGINSLSFSGVRCGYNSSTKSLKMPYFIADEEDILAETEKMKQWNVDQITQRYTATKQIYNNCTESVANLRPILAACQRMMYDCAGDEIAKLHIPQMHTEDIFDYRRELCRHIAANTYNRRLRHAVDTALQICNDVLKERGVM